jgi:rhodanese-related sulfurtransferase
MTINKEWQKIRVNKIAPNVLMNLLAKEDLYILDVRPQDFKRDASFIKGSRLCPLVYLADRFKEIPKDRRIVITDWAMKQSPTAAKFLTVKGYQIHGVLKGGIERWRSENLPVEEREPTTKFGPLSIPKQ